MGTVKALPIGGAVSGKKATVNLVVLLSKEAITESGGKLLSTAPDDVDSDSVVDTVTTVNPPSLG